jgi:tripartite-type tricarboxylate transporter receptor subunit TctC
MTRVWRTALATAALLISVASASAQTADYPSHPIRIIVPYTPGASTDNVSRAFANEASKALGKPIVIENRPGAGTAIGTQAAKQAPADGYTVLFAAGTLVSTMLGLKDPGYAVSDFTPVVMLGAQYYVLMIPAALPAKNLKEFIAYAQANSSKMNFAMLGPGAPSHVLADRFQNAAHFQWQDIAYKGGVPALQAIMSNEVQGYFGTQTFATAYQTSDKVRILAIAANKRGEFLPDVPTFKEAGIEGVTEDDWFALMVRSDTPAPIVAKLRTVFTEVMKTPEMKAQLQSNALSSYEGTMEAFPAAMVKEEKMKSEEMKRLGITPQ